MPLPIVDESRVRNPVLESTVINLIGHWGLSTILNEIGRVLVEHSKEENKEDSLEASRTLGIAIVISVAREMVDETGLG